MSPVTPAYFLLHAGCVPVKGISRSVIYDLHRNDFDFIPNDLYDIIMKYSGRKTASIYEDHSPADHEALDEYMGWLLDKEYLVPVEDPSELALFPPLDLKWEEPATITNAIIDIAGGEISLQAYMRLLDDLDDLGCHCVQFRIFGNYGHFLFYEALLQHIELLNIGGVELLVPHNPLFGLEDYRQVYYKYSRLEKMIVYNAPPDLANMATAGEPPVNIAFVPEMIQDHTYCGVVHPSWFTVNMSLFTESLAFNSCLNRKVGIDAGGEIKNCPSCKTGFGNIRQMSIKEVILDPAFRRLWVIGKDKVRVCNFCEFRYMCTDCRAYLEDDLDKPLKCGYDPLTCEWH